MPLSASISNISRTSIHDGPGVRTVVYFKGCGLGCLWCHNPETHSSCPDILYAEIKCIHCGRCVELCPMHHSISEGRMIYDRTGCSRCMKCVEACPSGALSADGKTMTSEEVFAVVKKDAHYFSQTGGGVTLSGGECLLWPDFCAELLRSCKSENISTLIETALFVPWENIEKILPFCDRFYTDLKIPSSPRHRRFTGQDNDMIIENLHRLSSAVPQRVSVRIPLIPSVNDSEADMADFAGILAPIAENLEGIELLRYNNLA
ncbi:MAG: glycyl-radical enzyme activating protein, partial [Clostridia bacterium]|nr:glycyl-radical enzyme activating protein [Clostridia bacterium]